MTPGFTRFRPSPDWDFEVRMSVPVFVDDQLRVKVTIVSKRDSKSKPGLGVTISRHEVIIGINSLPAVNHQPEFTAHCVKEEADQSISDGALTMAWTAIDAAIEPVVRNRLISAR